MNPLFLILLTASAATLAAAPARPTVEQLVAEVLTAHPELKFYEAELAAIRGERRTAGAWANPEVTVDAGRKSVQGDAAAEGVAWSVGAVQTFEWPGRVSLRKAIADRQVELAENGLARFRAALAQEVRRRACDLLTSRRKAEAAREVADRGEALVTLLVQRDPAGVAPQLESRAIEAAVLVLRRSATAAAQEEQSARFDLNQLRGAPPGAPLELSDATPAFPDAPPLDTLLRRAARNNPTLKQRELELAQQGFRVRLAANETWPSVTAGPVVSRETGGDTETVAGVTVSVPLPLWTRNRGGVETARARELQARTTLLLAQREVERRVTQLHAAYTAHRAEMRRWHADIDRQLGDAAAQADRHYRLGAVPLSTYLELQQQYLEGLTALLDTRRDAWSAWSELETLTGQPLATP